MRSEKDLECWAVLSLLQGLDGETVLRCVCVGGWLGGWVGVCGCVSMYACDISN